MYVIRAPTILTTTRMFSCELPLIDIGFHAAHFVNVRVCIYSPLSLDCSLIYAYGSAVAWQFICVCDDTANRHFPKYNMHEKDKHRQTIRSSCFASTSLVPRRSANDYYYKRVSKSVCTNNTCTHWTCRVFLAALRFVYIRISPPPVAYGSCGLSVRLRE